MLRTIALPIAASFLALAPPSVAAPPQEAAVVFDAPLVVADHHAQFETLIDWNDDGFMDAVSFWWTNDQYNGLEVDFYLNDGTGALVPGYGSGFLVYPSQSELHDSAVGDVDGDGDDDLVYARGRNARVYLSAGDGGSSGGATLSLPASARAIALCDFDLDGDLDLAVDHGELARYRNDGATWTLVASEQVASEVLDLETLDGDGAGALDLAVATPTHVMAFATNGFDLRPLFSFPHSQAMPMLTAGDVDSDGDDDLVSFDAADYFVVRQESAGDFVREAPIVGGPAWALHDVDGDGDLDGICCAGGGPLAVSNSIESTFHVSINDGTGKFSVAQKHPALGAQHIAGAADLDHDGDVDLVAGRVVYYSDRPGGFSLPPALASQPVSPEAIGDFDAEADPDVDPVLDSVRRNLGDGTHELHAPSMPDAPAGSRFVGPGFPGDFDGDGVPDLIVRRELDGGGFVEMRLLLNAGGGGYVDGGPAAAPGVSMHPFTALPEPRLSLVADMDGDGDQDLCSFADGLFTWSQTFWNDGTGSFTAGVQEQFWRPEAVADFDGDGLPDLLVVDSHFTGNDDDELMWRRGLGNAIFANPLPVGPGDYFNGRKDVAGVADMDGDGDLDVCASSYYGDVLIHRNDGTGAFTKVVVDEEVLLRYTSDLGRGLLPVDADGDGIQDLVAWGAGLTARNASLVYRGLGDLAFDEPVLQVMKPIAVADADGDGDLDAYSTHLHRNARFRGAPDGLRRQLGGGTPGALGMTPVLGASGPFRVGEEVVVHLAGGLGGASASIELQLLEPATPFASPVKRHFLTLGGAPGEPGAGASSGLGFVVPTAWIGRTLELRARVVDPRASGGESSSNALRLTFGV